MNSRKGQPPPQKKSVKRHATLVQVRQIPDADGYEFLHPRCALDRSEDLEEVVAMISQGEAEIATDELRWLLNGCPDLLAAHQYLGDIALADGDLPLARGHFGYAYHAGMKAWKQAGYPAPLKYSHPANRPFFDAGYGLVHCLLALNERRLAEETVAQMREADPSDPLHLQDLLDGKLPGCGEPTVADNLISLNIPPTWPPPGNPE